MKISVILCQFICWSIPIFGVAQEYLPQTRGYVGAEVSMGWLGDSNRDFPEHRLQKAFFLNIGKDHRGGLKDWEYYLKRPKTGISLGFSNLGNTTELGYVYSLLPYVEFDLFPKTLDKLSLLVAFGGSYITEKYDLETNPFNKAVSTHINWSYKSTIFYEVFEGDKTSWRIGLGYFHHSNGHIRKPNRGYNSILLGTSVDFENKTPSVVTTPIKERLRSTQWFYTSRFGFGLNTFTDVFNDKMPVYTAALSGGKVINKTFKFGAGVYYNFYQHYYDYIVNEETLIKTQEPQFADHPIVNASSFGIFGSGEILLGHVGIEMNIGFNLFKPFYKIDWQLNEGYTTFVNGEEFIILGDLNTYYQIKRMVSSRMGLKYYLFDTDRSPKHNIFIGAFINANLGQADFSELTVGYVHRFDF